METASNFLNGSASVDQLLPAAHARRSSLVRSISEDMLPSLSTLNATSLARYGYSPPSPTLSGASTPRRPGSARSSSSGWYTPNENNLTLEELAQRLNTRAKRLERYQGRCAQNIVMALLRPTPLVLFLFNPVCLMMFWLCFIIWWLSKSGYGID